MNKDLSQGPILKTLWLYCLPLLGSIILQQVYNLADSVVAGRFISEAALAAVGNATEITLIYTAFAMGCNMGCQVITSQLFGAKNIKGLKTGVSTACIAFGIACLLLMAFGFIFTKPLLELINTPEDILEDSVLYLRIYTLGMPFVFFYNIGMGIFGALGDSKTPFIFLAISSISNIVVDIIFVAVFNMGVAGVAWATFICQGLAAILGWIVLYRRLHSMKCEQYEKFSKKLLQKLAIVAIPSLLQQSFISVGNIIIQGIINGYGSSVVAGFTAAMKLNNIAIATFFAIASGLSAFFAQNIGAETYDRLNKGFRAANYFAFAIAVPFIILYSFFGMQCAQLFLGEEASAQAFLTAKQVLILIAPFYFVAAIKVITDGALRGAGAMKLFMIDTFVDLILRVGFAFLLSFLLGESGIWWSWGIGWTIGMVLAEIFYFKGYWKNNLDFIKDVN